MHQTIALHPHLARAWQVDLINRQGLLVQEPLLLTVTIRQLPVGFDAGLGMASLQPVTGTDLSPVFTPLTRLTTSAIWAEVQVPERPLVTVLLDPTQPASHDEDRWHQRLSPLPRQPALLIAAGPVIDPAPIATPSTAAPDATEVEAELEAEPAPRMPFLARRFDPQRSWRLDPVDQDPPQYRDDPQLHALILLAYVQHGYDHRHISRWRTMIRQMLARLQAYEQEPGIYGDTVLTQAVTAGALSELYAVSGDGALRPPSIRAVTQLLRQAVHDDEGRVLGWSQEDPAWIESELTALCLMAVHTALHSGLDSEPLDRITLHMTPWVQAAYTAAQAQGRGFPGRFNPANGAMDGTDQPHAALLILALRRHQGDSMTEALPKTASTPCWAYVIPGPCS